MERFTFFTDDYPAVTCDSCYEDQNENYTGPAIDRLAEYEATGLMPAEVATLIQELKYAKQQCREERRWIPVTERLPENEVDVLIAYTRKGIRGDAYFCVCTAFHTDGHTSTEDSSYNWEIDYVDMDYDEEADAYIVPEGWWETVDFGEEFSAVDSVVTHWMPMPEPPREGTP